MDGILVNILTILHISVLLELKPSNKHNVYEYMFP